MRAILAATVLLLSGCTTIAHGSSLNLKPGARYVAMGSSYAAGADMSAIVPGSPKRCGRTQDNYPHLLAAKLKLDLVDVSCGGATISHIIGPWSELPAQIEAITANTQLVTVTIGGNDVNYVRNLWVASCGQAPDRMPSGGRACAPAEWPSDAAYRALEQSLRRMAKEVRKRAPNATLVFVDYLRIVPDAGTCANVPLDETQRAAARESYRRVAEATRKAATAEGAILLPASQLSQGHDACSSNPWAAGHPGKPTDWHPTLAGHQAIAAELAARLR